MGRRHWPGWKEQWRWVCPDSSGGGGLSLGSPGAGGRDPLVSPPYMGAWGIKGSGASPGVAYSQRPSTVWGWEQDSWGCGAEVCGGKGWSPEIFMRAGVAAGWCLVLSHPRPCSHSFMPLCCGRWGWSGPRGTSSHRVSGAALPNPLLPCAQPVLPGLH